MTHSLFIEVSTEKGLVAFHDKGLLIHQCELPAGLHNSTFLLPAIQKGFQATGLSPQQLSYIAVGVGPGSYTGLRVGAIVAKTMAYAANIPLVGINSLAGFVPHEPVSHIAVIDAKIGGMYLLKNGSVPEIVPLDKASSYFESGQLLVTPKSHPLKQKLDLLYPNNTWNWLETSPNANVLGFLAWTKFCQKDIVTNQELELLYLRETYTAS